MKQIIFILILVLVGLRGEGQDTTFHLTLGTMGEEDAVDFFETNNGLILFGSTGQTENGQSDIYILNVSFDFKTIVSRTIGSSAIETLKTVCELNSGFYALASFYYDGYGNSDYDIRLDVIDSAGGLVTTKILKKTGVQVPIDLCASGESIYLLAKDQEDDSNVRFSILEFDFDLTEIQEMELETNDSIDLNSIQFYSEELWVIGGINFAESADSDLYLGKLALSGDLLAEATYGTARTDYGTSIFFDSDSSIIITGSSNGFDSLDYDSYVIKIDTAMNVIWEEPFGFNPFVQNEDDFGVQTIRAFNGKYFMGASTRTYGNGAEDYHLYQITNDGVFEEGNSYGMSGNETLKAILQGADSNFYLFGVSNTQGIGQSDFLLVKTPNAIDGPFKTYSIIEDTTLVFNYSVSVFTPQTANELGFLAYFQLSPIFTITSSATDLNAMIYNTQGQLIRQLKNVNNQIAFSDLSSGAYIFMIGNNQIGYKGYKIITPPL